MALLLALPFIGVALWLDLLRAQIHTFHHTDETIFHLGVIRAFAAELPFPDLRDYNSATTPLFHLVLAVADRLFGLELPGLRAVNVLISYGTVLYLFHLFHRQLLWSRGDALMAAAAIGVSPYFFGSSFLVLTDNLAWGLAVITCGTALSAVRGGRTFTWCAVAGWTALVLLTRQSYVWLYLAVVALAASAPGAWRDRVVRTGIVLSSALPLVPLVFMWDGLVPPTFQLGGGSGIEHRPITAVNLLAFNFVIAIVGVYALLIPARVPAHDDSDRRVVLSTWRLPGWSASLLAVLFTAALLSLQPMHRDMEFHNGVLWSVAERLPQIHGSSIAYWILMPIGMLRMFHAVRESRADLGNLGLIGVCLMALLSSAFVFQKYFDPAVPFLMLLACAVRSGSLGTHGRRLIGLLILGGCLYFLAQSRLTEFPSAVQSGAASVSASMPMHITHSVPGLPLPS